MLRVAFVFLGLAILGTQPAMARRSLDAAQSLYRVSALPISGVIKTHKTTPAHHNGSHANPVAGTRGAC